MSHESCLTNRVRPSLCLLPCLPDQGLRRPKGNEGCRRCADFPCGRIETYPFPVGRKVMLRSIPARRELGTGRRMEEEEKRYHCPRCGDALFHDAKRCRRCGDAVDLD